MQHWHIQQAARILEAGGVIAYPTETVYGLGCDPWDYDAVVRLLDIKRRSMDSGLILIAADVDQVVPYLDKPTKALKQKLTGKGKQPVTWLVRAPAIPQWVRGAHDKAAIRITTHPLARELCRTFGRPIVSTSANRSGRPPAQNALKIRKLFKDELDYILTGTTGPATKTSEIRDAETDKVYRS